MSKRKTAYAVEWMAEGDILVRGAQDPMKALELVVAHGHESSDFEDLMDGVKPGKIWRLSIGMVDNEPNPAYIADMAGWCYGLLERARPGYYRKVSCPPGSYGDSEGWTWMLGYCDGPARGAFPGVYFRGW